MRISLNPKAEWYYLVPGHIRVLAEPALDVVFEQAAQDQRIVDLRQQVEEATEAENLDAAADLQREIGKMMNLVVAELVIVEWEGIEDDKGKPAPVEPAYINAALRMPVLASAWDQNYMARWLGLSDMLSAEKNGSAPSLNGTSAAARNTAKPARRSATPAQTKKTGRKR
ncbi:conserved hypothetical protein [Ruegeria lacuscaerulensis ITI-1157]|nr:conserved hypothetical protein [Ruegeria lacuscaerulensis ITI-1157]SHK05785.1 hypothetical protein SAMN05444404_3205 [Ruegeria lacuscaerulensis ITI-1157]